jgi:hypothetical protein
MPRVPVASLLLLTGCSTPPILPPAPLTLVLALPAGTTVELLPPTGIQGAAAAVAGLWGVAMANSRRFDMAWGLESCPSPVRIALHLDASSDTFTTTLLRAGEPPLGLAAATRDPGLTAALDHLARGTLGALGEVPAVDTPSCAAVYSADPACVALVEEGHARLARGDQVGGRRLLEDAFDRDPGSPQVRAHLAAALANEPGPGNLERARTFATQSLAGRRLSPRNEHQLLRVIRLADRDDAGLLDLGRAYRLARPHDPQGTYTEALALNRLGRQAEALPLLRALRQRWPRSAGVGYQLCHALLATEHAAEVLGVLDTIETSLAPGLAVRPRTMALYHSGQQEELRRYLAALRAQVQDHPAELEVIRMQASHALLTQRDADATQLLGESMAWLRQRPGVLAEHSATVAEDGAVLLLLGADAALGQAIDGFEQLGDLPESLRKVLTDLRSSDPRRIKGPDEAPWVIAARYHALTQAGQAEEAAALAAQTRTRLLSFDQLRPADHPLMTPGRALAWRSLGNDGP